MMNIETGYDPDGDFVLKVNGMSYYSSKEIADVLIMKIRALEGQLRHAKAGIESERVKK